MLPAPTAIPYSVAPARDARPGRADEAARAGAPGAEAKAAGARDWSSRQAINSCETAARRDEMARVEDEFFADLCFMGEDSFAVPSFSPKLRAVWVVVPTHARGTTGVRPWRCGAGGPDECGD
jgi:hypothetical protein